MRTIVDLPEDQVAAVAKLCAKEGISRAEAVRRGLAKLLAEHESDGMAKAFGAWAKRKKNSSEIVRKLRSEWDQ